MTISTAGMIEAVRTAANMTKTQEEQDVLNSIANRIEILTAANAGMDLQLNSIRAALNIPINISVQAGVIAETTRLNEEVLSLRSQLSESVSLANKLRRTAKEHQEENQQLRTRLETYDRAAREPAEYKVVDPFGEITLRREKCEAEMYRELKGWNVTDLYTVPPLAVVPDEVTEFTKPNSSYEWRKGYNACIAVLQSGNPVWSGIDWAKGCEPTQAVPEGWALVPQQIFLEPSDIESICSQCGNGGEQYGDYTDGILWVGDIQDDAGNITHGLHISSSDYPEEGGITLAKFAMAPQLERKDGDA